MYHKFYRTFYFSSLSVHPSRKCIGRYKRIYKKAESLATHVLGFPFLTSYVLLDVICSTALGGRKPHEAIRWGWTKYQVTARGTNCWTIHRPSAGNDPCKTLTRMITRSSQTSRQHMLWVVFSGWWQMVCTAWLPRESLLPVTHSTQLSDSGDCRSLWFPKVQLSHLGSHHLIIKSFPPTHFSPISTIPGNSPQLISIA